MAKRTGLAPMDEFGTFPGEGSSLWNLLHNGITRSTDTAPYDYNCHTDAIDDGIITPHLGGPLQAEVDEDE